MFLRKFGEFLLQGTWKTPVIAFLFTFVPLFSWMGTVIMLLVTLRKGARAGAYVLFAVTVPSVVTMFMGHPWFGLLEWVYGPLLAYGLALVLRHTASWTPALYVGTVFGIVSVLLAHGFNSQLDQWWVHYLQEGMQKLAQAEAATGETSTSLVQLQAVLAGQLAWISKLMTGTFLTFGVVGALFDLVIARTWQAFLYNPGALRHELCSVRLHKIWVGLMFLTLALVFLGVNVAWDLMPLLLLPFIVVSLSLVHAMLGQRKNGWVWIIIFYIGLVVLSPYSLLLLVLAAGVDSFVDFRRGKM